jgi:hypothetical protein
MLLLFRKINNKKKCMVSRWKLCYKLIHCCHKHWTVDNEKLRLFSIETKRL